MVLQSYMRSKILIFYVQLFKIRIVIKRNLNLKIRKTKTKKNALSSSPQESEKIDKSINQTNGKENNCMNKGKIDNQNSESINELSQTPKSNPSTKMKKSENVISKELKNSDMDLNDDDNKEVEELKAFLKNIRKSKRKIFIKPNISQKWINDLKATLAKLQKK